MKSKVALKKINGCDGSFRRLLIITIEGVNTNSFESALEKEFAVNLPHHHHPAHFELGHIFCCLLQIQYVSVLLECFGNCDLIWYLLRADE